MSSLSYGNLCSLRVTGWHLRPFEGFLRYVTIYYLSLYYTNHIQIPHAFQQIVSQEKTPTLSHVLPAYEAMIEKWREFSEQHTEAVDIIQAGLNKLEAYQNHTDLTPAYCLAMRMCLIY
jgi:hypothetical protein